MVINLTNGHVSEETIAAWLDNMMSAEEETEFLKSTVGDDFISDILDINDDIVEDFEELIESGYEIPEELSYEFELPQISLPMMDLETYHSDADMLFSGESEEYEDSGSYNDDSEDGENNYRCDESDSEELSQEDGYDDIYGEDQQFL